MLHVQVICASVHLLDGGHEFDGRTEIAPVDPRQVTQTLQQLKQSGTKNIVVSAVFSPVNSHHELQVSRFRHNFGFTV